MARKEHINWKILHTQALSLFFLAFTLAGNTAQAATNTPLQDGIKRLGSCSGNVIFPVPIIRSTQSRSRVFRLIDCSPSSTNTTPLTDGILGLEERGQLFALPKLLFDTSPMSGGKMRLKFAGQSLTVPKNLSTRTGVVLSGNYWFQIQIASNHREVYQGLGNRFISLPKGTYDVINLTNGQRRNGIRLR